MPRFTVMDPRAQLLREGSAASCCLDPALGVCEPWPPWQERYCLPALLPMRPQ